MYAGGAVASSLMEPEVNVVFTPRDRTLRAVTVSHILQVLSDCHGNKSQTSAILGITRKKLYRALRYHKLYIDTIRADMYQNGTPADTLADAMSQNGTYRTDTGQNDTISDTLSEFELSTPSTDLSTEK